MLKVAAVFLLITCIYDVIRPFNIINQSRKEIENSWLEITKMEGFIKFAFSILVNIVAIIFFFVYLFE